MNAEEHVYLVSTIVVYVNYEQFTDCEWSSPFEHARLSDVQNTILSDESSHRSA